MKKIREKFSKLNKQQKMILSSIFIGLCVVVMFFFFTKKHTKNNFDESLLTQEEKDFLNLEKVEF